MNNMTWIKEGGIEMTYNTLSNLLKKEHNGWYTVVEEWETFDKDRVMTKYLQLSAFKDTTRTKVILFKKNTSITAQNHSTQLEHMCRIWFLREILDKCIFGQKGLFEAVTYVEPVLFKKTKLQIIKDAWKELWKN